jgi:hypothetical protein
MSRYFFFGNLVLCSFEFGAFALILLDKDNHDSVVRDFRYAFLNERMGQYRYNFH